MTNDERLALIKHYADSIRQRVHGPPYDAPKNKADDFQSWAQRIMDLAEELE